jgi:hypothetical protein
MDQSKQTMFGGKAVAMADVFKYTVGKDRLEGSVNYTVQMAAPEGESTGGGLAAMQHIALVPEGGGPSVVIGSANQATGRAELRTYAVVAEAYRNRFKGTAFPTVRWKYDDLLKKLRGVLDGQNLQVTVVDAPRRVFLDSGVPPVLHPSPRGQQCQRPRSGSTSQSMTGSMRPWSACRARGTNRLRVWDSA